MQAFNHKHTINDLHALRSLTDGFAFLNGTYERLHIAYDNYVASRGSPELETVGLSIEQARCLRAAYEGSARKYGLDWIPKLRDVFIGSCPMCGNTAIGTVEHYLPKAPYPEFSVFSWNLVPSCTSCNQKRGSRHVKGIKYHLLHPIFDHQIFSKLRLVTRFDTAGEIVNFKLGYHASVFDETQNSRISAHIEMCVDQRAFRFDTQVHISTMAARVANINVLLWKTVIADELAIMSTANLAFGWKASCLRGFLELDDNQLMKVIVPKILP